MHHRFKKKYFFVFSCIFTYYFTQNEYQTRAFCHQTLIFFVTNLFLHYKTPLCGHWEMSWVLKNQNKCFQLHPALQWLYSTILTAVFECPRLFSSKDPVENPSIDHTSIQAEVIVERWPDVPHRLQLLPYPRILQGFSILRNMDS